MRGVRNAQFLLVLLPERPGGDETSSGVKTGRRVPAARGTLTRLPAVARLFVAPPCRSSMTNVDSINEPGNIAFFNYLRKLNIVAVISSLSV